MGESGNTTTIRRFLFSNSHAGALSFLILFVCLLVCLGFFKIGFNLCNSSS